MSKLWDLFTQVEEEKRDRLRALNWKDIGFVGGVRYWGKPLTNELVSELLAFDWLAKHDAPATRDNAGALPFGVDGAGI